LHTLIVYVYNYRNLTTKEKEVAILKADPEMKKLQETITLPKWMVDQLREHSKRVNRSKGDLVEEALKSAFYFKRGE